VDAKGILMHIDRPDEVAVASKATLAANPSSAFGLVLTSRTPATGSSFGGGRARDAGLRGLVSQVVDILAVFPQGHAPVVVAAAILVAHAVRVADEERAYLVFHAEVDHLAARPRLSERMPRPVTIKAFPALVLTAARWISPKSTVACTAPGACAACCVSAQTCNSKP
jgi:hypothetical protein